MLPALLLSHLPGNGVGLGAQPGGLGPRWSPAAEKEIIAETFRSGEGEGPPAQNRNGRSTTECPTLSPAVPHPPHCVSSGETEGLQKGAELSVHFGTSGTPLGHFGTLEGAAVRETAENVGLCWGGGASSLPQITPIQSPSVQLADEGSRWR